MSVITDSWCGNRLRELGLFSQEKRRERDLTQPPEPKGAVRELEQEFSQGPVVIGQGEWLWTQRAGLVSILRRNSLL